jgi:hypothetical protein
MMRKSTRTHETKIPVRGDLGIIRRDAKTHRIISVWEKKNVITYLGTDALIKLIAPNAAFGATVQQENQIKSMRFGTSNITPQRTDTNLLTEAVVSGNPVRIAFADSNRIIGASGTVEFTASMASGFGNGVTYREACLFTRGTDDDPLITTGAVPFSRQVYPDQTKTSAVTLEFRWRITYTV